MKSELGNRIKEWRKQKKLTQEEMAALIDHPAPNTIEAISKVLGIPVHEFYKNSEESKNKRQQLIDKAVGILYNLDDKSLKVA